MDKLQFKMNRQIFRLLEMLALCEGGNLNLAVEAGWLDLSTGQVTEAGHQALAEHHRPKLGDWYMDANGIHRVNVILEQAVGVTLRGWNGVEFDSTIHKLQWFSDWSGSHFFGRAGDFPAMPVADFVFWVLLRGHEQDELKVNGQPVVNPNEFFIRRDDTLELNGLEYRLNP